MPRRTFNLLSLRFSILSYASTRNLVHGFGFFWKVLCATGFTEASSAGIDRDFLPSLGDDRAVPLASAMAEKLASALCPVAGCPVTTGPYVC